MCPPESFKKHGILPLNDTFPRSAWKPPFHTFTVHYTAYKLIFPSSVSKKNFEICRVKKKFFTTLGRQSSNQTCYTRTR